MAQVFDGPPEFVDRGYEIGHPGHPGSALYIDGRQESLTSDSAIYRFEYPTASGV